ncbi:MAG TPA: gamma carbonic anhydrase family protein [Burkholderiales bacterium]|jgi:carbonic anhydrase/acetyltransferase-like protein (isoleucine patch superfamily)|nr:gamma carbonic anhydrase family protein [Burkholderiales bacterium]
MSIYSLGERKVAFHGEEWFIAENATVIGTVILHDQASVWFNCVLRGDSDIITIGERTNIQDASVLHADPGIPLTLGKDVSVGHMAMLHGCTIGDGSLVGIGAIIMNHAVIGSRCLIGAGTLIPEGKTYPDGVLVLGSPGKIVRELKAEEKEGLLKIADGYVRRSKLYRERLKPQER